MKNLSRYCGLYYAMFKASFISDLEYRANFVTRILTDIFWYVAQIATFEVLYRHTERIGDWNVQQMRVFLGVIFLVDGIVSLLFTENLDNFSEKIRKGDLDLLLTKPVDSQFMISLQRASTAYIGNILLSVAWLGWSLSQFADFEPLRLLWMLALVPCGVVITYVIRFLFATTAIVLTRSENLQFIWWQLYRIGTRPDSAYVPWFKWLILTAFPVGVIASVPARALLDPPDYFILLWPLILTPTFVYLSHRFWRYSLKHYTSASS